MHNITNQTDLFSFSLNFVKKKILKFKWNLDMYPEKINETYERCVKNNFKDIETDLSSL